MRHTDRSIGTVVSKKRAASVFSVEDGGSTFFLLAGNYLPVDTASYSRKRDSSVTQLLFADISPRTPGFNPGIVKRKAIPLQDWTVPEGLRKSRFSYFKTVGT